MDWHRYRAALWRGANLSFHPIKRLDNIHIDDLLGIDEQRERLAENTQAFLAGNAAEYALLLGGQVNPA